MLQDTDKIKSSNLYSAGFKLHMNFSFSKIWLPYIFYEVIISVYILSMLLDKWRSMLRFPSLRSTMRRFMICWPPPRKKEERNLRSVIFYNSLYLFSAKQANKNFSSPESDADISCSDLIMLKDYRLYVECQWYLFYYFRF